MNDRAVIEAILFLAEEPIPASLIGQVLENPSADVQAELEALQREWDEQGRGVVLRESALGWRLSTHPDCAPWLERFVRGHSTQRLTTAALEVLAIVAYRGPVARSQIAEIRGIDSDGVVKTLLARELLVEEQRPGEPGGPVLFTVSDAFLERLGLKSLEELPPLTSFMPDAEAVEAMEAKLSPGA